MDLFKNEVGRPSNETLKKRKQFKVFISVFAVLAVLLVGFGIYKVFTPEKIEGENLNATTSSCVMPYTKTKCNLPNSTVSKIQQMLKKKGYYKTLINGIFNSKTEEAVKAFQKSQKITPDGLVGPDTLERLAKATNTKYFILKYNKNGGSGSLNSQYNNTQIVINGINTKISTTKLKKSGYTHVGYTVTSKVGTTKYRHGCFEGNCSKVKAYTEKQIEEKNDKFYDAVYDIGAVVSETGWVSGQEVQLTAKYCLSGASYNKKTKRCEGALKVVGPSKTAYNTTTTIIFKVSHYASKTLYLSVGLGEYATGDIGGMCLPLAPGQTYTDNFRIGKDYFTKMSYIYYLYDNEDCSGAIVANNKTKTYTYVGK